MAVSLYRSVTYNPEKDGIKYGNFLKINSKEGMQVYNKVKKKIMDFGKLINHPYSEDVKAHFYKNPNVKCILVSEGMLEKEFTNLPTFDEVNILSIKGDFFPTMIFRNAEDEGVFFNN